MARNLRLQVALAQLGVASRRGAKEFIKAGRVQLNGKVVYQPGERVDLEKDTITVDGRSSCIQKKVYFILNKPAGFITTVKDRFANRTVFDLIKPKSERIYPVGRLDKDTRGLLLLTNDGKLTYHLTHPKFGIKKVYRVCVQGSIPKTQVKRLESGISLEGKKTYPCKIKLIADKGKTTDLNIQLTEGRKRQIKKMFAGVGHPVLAIERIGFGPLKLGKLKPGLWRELQASEIAELKQVARSR